MNAQMLRSAILMALVAIVWSPQLAEAQIADPALDDERSSITGNVDFELGPYYPSIDAEFGGSAPFRGSFGSNDRVLAELGATYYLFKQHGKFGVEFGAGYTKFSGSSEIRGVGNGETDGSDGGSESADGNSNGENSTDGGGSDGLSLREETNFVLFPLRLSLMYRWDFLVEQWGFPLAPRVEGGLDYYVWKITDGSGDVATAGGKRARGATPGFHVAAGAGLLLDVFTPRLAAAFDINWGINNTYLYGEYEVTRIQGFQSGGFNLSDESWKIGLAFEF